jgi:hypothetical protein
MMDRFNLRGTLASGRQSDDEKKYLHVGVMRAGGN